MAPREVTSGESGGPVSTGPGSSDKSILVERYSERLERADSVAAMDDW